MKFDRNGLVRCRVCGCTEVDACEGGCAWEQGEKDLCSTCGTVVRALLKWNEEARRPTLAALLRELKRQIERKMRPANGRRKR